MPVAPLQCPLCAGVLQIDSAWGGQAVACPLCHGTIALPPEAILLAGLTPPACQTSPAQPAPPPAIDELFPPGASAERPRPTASGPDFAADRNPPQTKPTAAQRPASPPEDHLYPPGMQPPTRARPSAAQAIAQATRSPAEREAADVLPPAARQSEVRPTARGKRNVDDLLPPSAGSPDLPEPAAKAVPTPAEAAAALLPPGAKADEPLAASLSQVTIPRAPQRLPQLPESVASGAAIPTASGDYIAVKESPKVIGSGDDEVEVRRLAPEEKARRRLRRNLVLWTFCLLVLIAVFYFFTR